MSSAPAATLTPTAAPAVVPAACTALMRPFTIHEVHVGPLNGTLRTPFPIASDRTKIDGTQNVYVAIREGWGATGCGEAAPFFGVSGDTQGLLFHDLRRVSGALIGKSFTVASLDAFLQRQLTYPAARAAMHMAVCDLLAQSAGVPLFRLFNPRAQGTPAPTMITIPLTAPGRAHSLAEAYLAQGFRQLKIKVGVEVALSVRRAVAVSQAVAQRPDSARVDLILDANEGYTVHDAARFLSALQKAKVLPWNRGEVIFEQPVPRADHVGLARLRRDFAGLGVQIFADESVYTLEDAEALVGAEAVDGINIKPQKTGGLLTAERIALYARAHGLRVMWGGMVESALGMSATLHLAQALGMIDLLDLDTPLLTQFPTVAGGMTYAGPLMTLPEAPGIGARWTGVNDTGKR